MKKCKRLEKIVELRKINDLHSDQIEVLGALAIMQGASIHDHYALGVYNGLVAALRVMTEKSLRFKNEDDIVDIERLKQMASTCKDI